MAIDLGTGSGRAVLRRAAREPRTLFVGIDADSAAMAEASRRAARPTRRGGTPNAIFVVAAGESLPAELSGTADAVTVALPWGSLLRGLATAEPSIVDSIAVLLKPQGELELLISTAERDGLGFVLDDERADSLVEAYSALGFACGVARSATALDVDRLSSGWGRRLGIPERRPAWLLRVRYAGVAGASGVGAAGGLSVGPSSL